MTARLLITIKPENGSPSQKKKVVRFDQLGPISVGVGKDFDISLDDFANDWLESHKFFDLKISFGQLYLISMGRDHAIQVITDGELMTLSPFQEISLKNDQEIMIEGIPCRIQAEFNEERASVLSDVDFSYERKDSIPSTDAKELHSTVYREIKNDIDHEEKIYEVQQKLNQILLKKSDTETKLDLANQDLKLKVDSIENSEKRIQNFKNEENDLREKILKTKEDYNSNVVLLKGHEQKVEDLKSSMGSLQQEINEKKKIINKLNEEKSLLETQLQDDRGRLKSELKENDQFLKQKNKTLEEIEGLKKELHFLYQEVDLKNATLKKILNDEALENAKLDHLKEAVKSGSLKLSELQRLVEVEDDKLRSQSKLNLELGEELAKIQSKLALRKIEANKLDFEVQDYSAKLINNKSEYLQLEKKINVLKNEENEQHAKIQQLKFDYDDQIQSSDKKLKSLQDEINRKMGELNHEKTRLEQENSNVMMSLRGLAHELDSLRQTIKNEEKNIQNILNDKKSQEKNLLEIVERSEAVQLKTEKIRLEFKQIQDSKQKAENELVLLKNKIKNFELELVERKDQALLEIENLKREERAKIENERAVMMAQMEVSKQRDLNDIELKHQKMLDEIAQKKSLIEKQVEDILNNAHGQENQMISLATQRLNEATAQAAKREEEAFKTLREAQMTLKNKEFEQDENLKRDFNEKKKKMKSFLAKKHEQALLNIQKLEEDSTERLKKIELNKLEEIEQIKRKELKKVMVLRDEELSKNKEQLEQMKNELQLENDRSKKYIEDLQAQQESELESKKKSVLEHLNSSQVEFNEKFEYEKKKAEDEFEQTKKIRIENATNAITHLLNKELSLDLVENGLKQKIEQSLKISLNGVDAAAHHDVVHMLDFNPKLYKEFFPVMKKYGLRAIPVALVLLFAVDFLSMRSAIVDFSKKTMKQRESATDLFVEQQKKEWKEKYTYTPTTSEGYKDSYTDNILFTTNFMTVMEDQEFQNDWILKLHDFMVKDLELSEDLAINYISVESAILKDLESGRKEINPQQVATGVEKLRLLEKDHLKDFAGTLEKDNKWQKFADFRKSFYDHFVKEKQNVLNRVPAAESASTTSTSTTPSLP